MTDIQIAVIGAGVNGVATALAILQRHPNCKLTVYSEEFSPNTTGDGAAGLWEPFACPGTPSHKINKWSKTTWDLLYKWYKEGQRGINFRKLTAYLHKKIDLPSWAHIPFNFEELSTEEVKKFNSDYECGFQFNTIVAEATFFLPRLMQEVKSLGGIFIQKKILSLEELGSADLIVVCVGLGARELVQDDKVFPIRGQVMRINAPFIQCCYIEEGPDYVSYILPNEESVVVGGTVQHDNWSTVPSKEDKRNIINHASKFFPEIKNCQILKEWAGLRPARKDGVRLESEIRTIRGRKVPIIHNYGHGGSGVTLFWGCALEVSNIASDIISNMLPVPKSHL